MNKRLRASIICFSISILLLLFQNCAGGEGTTVKNPLEALESIQFGLKSFNNPNVSVSICINKVMIDVIEFNEEVPFDEDITNIVGSVTAIDSQEIGEARMIAGPNPGDFVIFSWFSDDFRTVNLTGETQMIFSLELPLGRYESPRFSTKGNECAEINNHSIEITNTHGSFYSDIDFELSESRQFEINNEQTVIQALDIQSFVDDLENVTSNSELDTVVNSL